MDNNPWEYVGKSEYNKRPRRFSRRCIIIFCIALFVLTIVAVGLALLIKFVILKRPQPTDYYNTTTSSSFETSSNINISTEITISITTVQPGNFPRIV
ncbi:hypothetical protein I4U23_015219 [Adineta vaga]|nr:hypothetical protein I4U23_015219 [Adineta vaga]